LVDRVESSTQRDVRREGARNGRHRGRQSRGGGCVLFGSGVGRQRRYAMDGKAMIGTLGIAAIAVGLFAGEAEAVTRTRRVTPTAAKKLADLYPKTSFRTVERANGPIVVRSQTTSVTKTVTGNKVTVSRKTANGTSFVGEYKEKDRSTSITINLQTGEVTLTCAYDVSVQICWPVLWGICGPCATAGMDISVSGSSGGTITFNQGPYIGAGVGCGLGCATIALNIELRGGARETITSKAVSAGLYLDLDLSLTANACGVVKYRLATWPLRGIYQEAARINL